MSRRAFGRTKDLASRSGEGGTGVGSMLAPRTIHLAKSVGKGLGLIDKITVCMCR